MARETLGLATDLMGEADRNTTHAERYRRKQLGQLKGGVKTFAGAAPERVFRPSRSRLQLEALREVVATTGIPDDLRFLERAGLWLATSRLASVAPGVVMAAVRRKILAQVGGFVEIFQEPDADLMIDSLEEESDETGIGTEVNLVVEAATSREQAEEALEWYKDAIDAQAVHYGREEGEGNRRKRIRHLAIKPTALVPLSGSAIATESSSKQLANALRALFAQADQNHDGDNASVTEICIDSEASPLLDMTRDAVLAAAKDFPRVRIKIALQSYLKDSEERLLKPFLGASEERVRNGGVPLGVRLVKGANTLWEQMHASRMGWGGTPLLETPEATDANYLHMMRMMLDPLKDGKFTLTHASMNVITISHNLIELAKAGVFAANHGNVSFAMLRGMTGPEVFREMKKRYGVACHEYVPVISLAKIVELFKYYLRRIDEIAGDKNYLGTMAKHGVDSDPWRATQVSRYLGALSVDHRNEAEVLYPHAPGIKPMRGAHEPVVECTSMADYRITPAMNPGAREDRAWIKQRIHACKERTGQSASEIKIPWASNRIRQVKSLRGPTLPDLKLASVEYATERDIDLAFRLAKEDPSKWGGRSMEERLAILANVEGEMRKGREGLVEALMLDAGKSVPEADAEVDEGMDFLRLTVLQWRELLKRDHLEFTTEGNGTAVVSCPKNFPQAIPAAHIAALLAVGYRVIVKPSGGTDEETILSTWEMVRTFHRAGVPESALIFLPCDNTCAAYLCAHPDAERIRFTGSSKTAKKIHESNPDVDMMAETGAQNVAIIDSSMDLKEAAQMIVGSVCGFAGQKCSKLRLVIATEDVDMAELKRHLLEIMKLMLVDNALRPEVDVTPLRKTPESWTPFYKLIMQCQEGEEWLLKPESPGRPGIRIADPAMFTMADME